MSCLPRSPYVRRLCGPRPLSPRGVPDRRFLSSASARSRRAALRLWRTALAWPSTLARRAGWSSRFSPSSMRARRTICRLTGSLSAVVAFPAKTRARSRTSWERMRRTLVLFSNITTSVSCRPGDRPDACSRYIVSTCHTIYNMICPRSREIAWRQGRSTEYKEEECRGTGRMARSQRRPDLRGKSGRRSR